MAAGGVADDPDPVGIHAKRTGVGTEEPDGALHVLDLRRPARLGRQPVVRQQADKTGLTEQFPEPLTLSGRPLRQPPPCTTMMAGRDPTAAVAVGR